jgi:hypothetical protein
VGGGRGVLDLKRVIVNTDAIDPQVRWGCVQAPS